MLSLKDALCLLAILVAYGIAGRIDDDVVTPRQAKHVAQAADCTFGEERGPQGPMAPTNTLATTTLDEEWRESRCLRNAP